MTSQQNSTAQADRQPPLYQCSDTEHAATFTYFAGDTTVTTPKQVIQWPWAALPELFRGMATSGPKGCAGYLVAAEVTGERCDSNAGPAMALVGDYEPAPGTAARWDLWPCAFVAHTTASHDPAVQERWRVYLLPVEPVPAELYTGVRRALEPTLPAGTKIRGRSQPAYLPTYTEGQPLPEVRTGGSGALDWRAVLSAVPKAANYAPPSEVEPSATQRTESDATIVRELASVWQKRTTGHRALGALGGVLHRLGVSDTRAEWIADALATATESTHENPTGRVLEAYDGAHELGWPALKLALGENGAGLVGAAAEVAGKISMVLNRVERLIDASVTAPVASKAAPSPATDTAAREHPSEDATGCKLNPLTGWPWILQKGNFYWLHNVSTPDYRTEVPAAELISAIARNLTNQIGEKERTLDELRNCYTHPVALVRSTYTARAHTYDPNSNALTLAALRWTTREPKRHEHIDRWLRALFGTKYENGAQWLASLVALDRPAPCLYLPGELELGKSLLADGLAALWGLSLPAPLDEAFSQFNEATASCPLIFGDEGFPDGMSFNKFREMITQHGRRVNEKYRAKVTVEGCARFIIAANNERALHTQRTGALTKADLAAIADRLLVIPCQSAARAEVAKLDTKAAASHEIAEHALWIASTVALQPPGKRMAAAPGGGESILAGVVAGRHAEILKAIRGALGEKIQPPLIWRPKKAPAEIWISVQRLEARLRANESRLSLEDVREFCAAYQLRPGAHSHKVDGINTKWRELDRISVLTALDHLD